MQPESKRWIRYEGSLTQVAVGPFGVWGVAKNQTIWEKLPSGWKKIEGLLTEISVGKNSIWGINRNQQIYKRIGGEGKWEQIRKKRIGKLTQVNILAICAS